MPDALLPIPTPRNLSGKLTTSQCAHLSYLRTKGKVTGSFEAVTIQSNFLIDSTEKIFEMSIINLINHDGLIIRAELTELPRP